MRFFTVGCRVLGLAAGRGPHGAGTHKLAHDQPQDPAAECGGGRSGGIPGAVCQNGEAYSTNSDSSQSDANHLQEEWMVNLWNSAHLAERFHMLLILG